jgi:hypothetical protein
VGLAVQVRPQLCTRKQAPRCSRETVDVGGSEKIILWIFPVAERSLKDSRCCPFPSDVYSHFH